MQRLPCTLWLAAVAGGAVLTAFMLPPAADAQLLYDHLKCYQLAVRKGQWTANGHALDQLTLTPLQAPPFEPEPGCILLPKGKPKPAELCVPVDKQPRQDPSGAGLADDWLCYRIKCPPGQDISVSIFDQFGSGSPVVKRKPVRRKLCVPARKGTPPPTPTPTPTPTPEVPTLCCQFPWSPAPSGAACLDAVSPDVDQKCNLLGGTILPGRCNPETQQCTEDIVPPNDFCCECRVPSPPFPHPQFCFEGVVGHEVKCPPDCSLRYGSACDPVSEACAPW